MALSSLSFDKSSVNKTRYPMVKSVYVAFLQQYNDELLREKKKEGIINMVGPLRSRETLRSSPRCELQRVFRRSITDSTEAALSE